MITVVKNGRSYDIDDTYVSWGSWWGEWARGAWEPETFALFDKYITKDTTYVDIGAWIGPTVLYAAGLAKRCIALEPDPLAHKQLVGNLSANSLQVDALQEAVADYDGCLKLGNTTLGDSTTRVSESTNSFEVPCCTFETLATRFNLQDPLFIKIDIEGAEEFALRSAFFSRKPTVYISIHPYWFKDRTAGLETVFELGYKYKHQIDTGHGSYLFTDLE